MSSYWTKTISLKGSIGITKVHVLEPQKKVYAPVVTIHGWASTGYFWYLTAKRLQEHGFPVYAIDLPGHGESDNPPDVTYDFSLMREYLEKLLDYVNEPVILAGHSMGGAIAMNYFMHEPNRIYSLILANTSAKFWQQIPKQISTLIPPKLIQFSQATFMKFYSKFWSWKAELRDTVGPELLDKAFNTEVHVIKSTYENIITKWDGGEDLSMIHVPTLLAVGSLDVVTFKGMMENLMEKIPTAVMRVYKGVSHHLPLEKGEAFADLIHTFAPTLSPRTY